MLGKHSLKPGEKTELKSVFMTKNAPGPFEKITTLQTDSPGQEQIELVMFGTVKETPGPKISVSPRRLDIGVIKKGDMKKVKIIVTNSGERPLILTSIKTKSDSAAHLTPPILPITIDPGKKVEADLIIASEKLGSFSERIYIISNAKNTSETGFVILVTGKVE